MQFRKSHTELNQIYFFTATIHKWFHLLADDENKKIITDYLKHLHDQELLSIYRFVIMPNHIHIMWEQLKKNGKESPQGSFLKFTAYEFLKKLKVTGESKNYEVKAANKKHEIWQRDSLSVKIYSRAVAKQKLDYMHFNPVSKKWSLSKDDLGFYYSSARFYETGLDEFGFLKSIFEVFDGK